LFPVWPSLLMPFYQGTAVTDIVHLI